MKMHLSFLILLLISFPLHATTYKWVNPQGQVQYTQNPPANAEFITINKPFPSNQNTSDESQQNVERMEAEFNKNQEKAVAEKKQAQQQAQETEMKAKNCAQAQNYLNNLNSRARVQIVQPDGQVKWLTPEELAAEKAKTQKMIESYCIP